MPKPTRLDVPRFQIFITDLVLRLLFRKSMLTTVCFQVVSRLGAIKVEVVLAHFMLSPKFVAGESAVAQNRPQLFLGPRTSPAQDTGKWVGVHRRVV
jgi:hypothetical protein